MMENLKVRIKKLHKDAVIPSYAKNGDAGLDLTAVGFYYDTDGNVVYNTGLAFEIPEGYVGLVFPRSSVCKKDLSLSNAVGVIDSGYRGEVLAKFKPTLCFLPNEDTAFLDKDKFDGHEGVYIPHDNTIPISPSVYGCGERIAQLIIIPYPNVKFEVVDELTETERGTGGYGSTNK